MRRYKLVLLVLILCLGIGFASVSTTLTIDAGAELSKNSEDFDVRFTSAVVDSVNLSSTIIGNNGTEISFGTKDLITAGDKSVLDFTVINNSTLYGADIDVECTSNDDYSSLYTVTKELSNSSMRGLSDKSGRIIVTLNTSRDTAIRGALTCNLTTTPIEKTTGSRCL